LSSSLAFIGHYDNDWVGGSDETASQSHESIAAAPAGILSAPNVRPEIRGVLLGDFVRSNYTALQLADLRATIGCSVSDLDAFAEVLRDPLVARSDIPSAAHAVRQFNAAKQSAAAAFDVSVQVLRD
jgi:hypothetical protein